MNKDLNHREICRAICRAQEIICDLNEQNNFEISETKNLKKAFDSLQEVFNTQIAKACTSLITDILDDLQKQL